MMESRPSPGNGRTMSVAVLDRYTPGARGMGEFGSFFYRHIEIIACIATEYGSRGAF